VDHLAALTGLTRLAYENNDPVWVDAASAIAQLTRLRSLELRRLPTFSDVQLAQLSTLSRLTFLSIGGDKSAANAVPHCHMHTTSIATVVFV
jgi:hypothetical protein